MNFDQYYNSDRTQNSIFKNVPVELLSEFKNQYKDPSLRIRYRGPRMDFKKLDVRNDVQCHSECLKKRAQFFSVYVKNC